MDEIDCGTAKVVGDEDGRLLVGNLDHQRPPAAGGHVQYAGDRAASIRDFVDDGPAQLGRHRFGTIERHLPRCRVEHRQPAGQVAAQLAEHVRAGGVDDRLPDDVVDAFGSDDPAAVDIGVRHGPPDRPKADRVGHGHHGEAQLIGQSDCRRGEFGRGGVKPDHQAAHSLLGQAADQRRLAAGGFRERLAVLHQQLAAGEVRPWLLEIGCLSPRDLSVQAGGTRLQLHPQMGGVDQVGDAVDHRCHRPSRQVSRDRNVRLRGRRGRSCHENRLLRPYARSRCASAIRRFNR